ncbi:MAG: hypothetical protein V3S88_01475 [Alphaproteobacteria bacterium]
MSWARIIAATVCLLLPLGIGPPAFAGGGERASAGAKEAFLAGLEDVPLMPGLAEIEDAGVVFDKPEGRIVEAYARGELSASQVLSFYNATLPQLGWRAESGGRFRREGEVLRLAFTTAGKRLTVRFSLSPD